MQVTFRRTGARRVDDLAERWHSLHVGESLTVCWPRPERRRRSDGS